MHNLSLLEQKSADALLPIIGTEGLISPSDLLLFVQSPQMRTK